MKVIDLLNKIANGEIEENKEYLFYGSDYCTIRDFFNRYIVDKENLNLKVEIIEEDKKIEHYYFSVYQDDRLGGREVVESLESKINEIIDKLNEMEKE